MNYDYHFIDRERMRSAQKAGLYASAVDMS